VLRDRISELKPRAETLQPACVGFSLVELMIVVAIALIIAAIAIPAVTKTMDVYRTRGAMANVAGMFQRCRLQGIKDDTSERILGFTTPSGGQPFFYCKDLANQNNAALSTDPQILLIPQMSVAAAPQGTPPRLTPQRMWGANFANVGVDKDPFFNSRGLPCSAPVPNGACSKISGYVEYFKYTSQNTRWAAISISPAGRVQTWFWNGNSWGN